MSTNDVPGAVAANSDSLHAMCWAESAEANDQSLLLVEGTEGGQIVFSVFDLAKSPIMEYRTSMEEKGFKKMFSWSLNKSVPGGKWTWHDKTPFPWSKIMKFATEGYKFASADEQLTAAEKVRRDLGMRGAAVNIDKLRDIEPTEREGAGAAEVILRKFGKALDKFIGEHS